MISRLSALVAVLVISNAWLGTAQAAPIVVDWDVVPHTEQEIHHGDSPFYSCEGDVYTERLCRWLWEDGLTLEATLFSFYDDKWFDGYGLGDTDLESVQRIRPECKPGLAPCFDTFTPLTLRIEGAFAGGPPPNLFFISSLGGLILAPSVVDIVSIDFAGSQWQGIEWFEVGFYLPDICDGDDPPEDEQVCDPSTEKALIIQDLRFDAVPEPALVSLFSVAALGLGVRWRFRS